MNHREAWSEFICAPERAGRHLASIGRGSTGAYASVAVDLVALQDFLDRIEDERGPELLTQFVDLTLGGYAEFAELKLHRLLDALSSEQVSQTAQVGPSPSGRVQWARTMMARQTGGLPPGRYIAQVSQRSFDLPINRVLAWLISDLVQALDRVKKAVHSSHLSPELERLDVLLQEAQRHHWLSAIKPSANIEIDLANARIDLGRPGYGDVLDLAKRRQRLQDRDQDRRWQNLLNLLAVGWLMPLGDDDLFELYVLVLTLDVLEYDLGLGAPTAIDLVRPGRREIAKFEVDERIVSVFFDQAYGPIVGGPTRYPPLTRLTPLISSHPRRPDIIVTVSGPGGIEASVLVEAKNTTDPDYISASIYRCYGYIHDFDPAGFLGKNGPACVLLIKGGISGAALRASDLIVIEGDMRDELASTLRKSLSIQP